jgi:hypothetical protein
MKLERPLSIQAPGSPQEVALSQKLALLSASPTSTPFCVVLLGTGCFHVSVLLCRRLATTLWDRNYEVHFIEEREVQKGRRFAQGHKAGGGKAEYENQAIQFSNWRLFHDADLPASGWGSGPPLRLVPKWWEQWRQQHLRPFRPPSSLFPWLPRRGEGGRGWNAVTHVTAYSPARDAKRRA